MDVYRRVLSADPRSVAAHKGLGVALCQTGALGRGTRMLRRACELDPTDSEAWTNLANACLASHDLRGCEEASRRAVSLDPGSAVAHNNLSAALRGLHDIDGSFDHASIAVGLAPAFAQAHVNLGAAHQSAGAAREARRCFAEASRLDPGETRNTEAHLFALHYDEAVTPEEVLAAHQAWGAGFPTPPRPPMRQTPETIGFVSGDLRAHPVGRFLMPLLAELAPTRRVVLYSNNPADDAATEAFRALPVEWRDIVGRDSSEAAETIRRDGVDVLFDLSGHTSANRLDVFALRPAPVQVTWLGYSATTGLPTMDWFLGDEHVFPPNSQPYATEGLARLSTAFLVDSPRDPVKRRNLGAHIRIGVTNNPAKLSDSYLSAVAQIVADTEDTIAVFKYGSADCDLVRRRIRSAMEACGVGSERFEVVGALPESEHRAFLVGLDFCVDSFPYNGATTTMDALHAGVPVLTLSGRCYSSRMTGSLLHHVGLNNWITGSVDQLVGTAIALSNDRSALHTARDHISRHLPSSALLDAKAFAAAFERSIADMWAATVD